MDRPDAAIAQYLDRFAQASADTHWPFGAARFDHVVVVPAFAESAEFIHQALARRDNASWLLIVVVNAPVNASAADIASTQALLQVSLPPPLARVRVDAGHAWHDERGQRAVWLVDRVADGRRLAPKDGVGLARKIGMDLALRAIARGRIDTPAIWCCDGDGDWPDNYFSPRMAAHESALTFDFRHVGPAAAHPAQQVYDLRIRDYPAQLRAARSPYAFQALGSAMAVSATHYARVRGCPRRAAGEDFHLLAKLAKVGAIRMCDQVTVSLRARESLRVPFGTGRGVATLAAGGAPWDAPVFYSSRSFRVLGTLLLKLSQWLEQPPANACEATLRQQGRKWLAESGAASLPLEVLQPATLWPAVQRATAASVVPATRLRHFHTHFDALRTLRLLHRLRDAGLKNASARELATGESARLQCAGASPATLALLQDG